MLRRISTGLLVAAIVTSATVLGAQTKAAPAKTAPAKTAPAKATAPAGISPADAAPLLGTWTIPLETPTGRLVATLVFRVEAGKVVAGISAPQFPEHKITDITKAGQVFTLKASTNYRGALTAYSGPVRMVLTLRPKAPDMAAWLDFNEAGYQIGGTATKKS
jgi:hypothetical protein